jgi:hypothetical protein
VTAFHDQPGSHSAELTPGGDTATAANDTDPTATNAVKRRTKLFIADLSKVTTRYRLPSEREGGLSCGVNMAGWFLSLVMLWLNRRCAPWRGVSLSGGCLRLCGLLLCRDRGRCCDALLWFVAGIEQRQVVSRTDELPRV